MFPEITSDDKFEGKIAFNLFFPSLALNLKTEKKNHLRFDKNNRNPD